MHSGFFKCFFFFSLSTCTTAVNHFFLNRLAISKKGLRKSFSQNEFTRSRTRKNGEGIMDEAGVLVRLRLLFSSLPFFAFPSWIFWEFSATPQARVYHFSLDWVKRNPFLFLNSLFFSRERGKVEIAFSKQLIDWLYSFCEKLRACIEDPNIICFIQTFNKMC